ncbi:MAG: TetR/AcrR family transcriptional regulator [Rhodobacterales bacterium]|nr:TetR/AcrR family transcriptional regulator [Rhodobacterales bacterium]
MRAALMRAGRKLFIEHGFSATGTPEIVAEAGVTRGALYHHFSDKEALFAAVIRAEAEAIATEIESSGGPDHSPIDALIQGGEAFLAAMRAPGRARLMLVEAPAALPSETLADIDAATGGRTLEEGLRAAGVQDARIPAALLSAAYDRAALAISQGDSPEPWQQALQRLVAGILP